MSFQIEYTGSLVDNRDVPQVSAASSLTRQVFSGNLMPPDYEFNAVAYPSGSSFEGNFSVAPLSHGPETRLYSDTGADGSSLLFNGNKGTGVGEAGFRLGANFVPSGVIRVVIRISSSVSTSNGLAWINGAFSENRFFPSGTAGAIFDETFTSNGGSIVFSSASNNGYGIDYIRIYQQQNLVVNITPSTLTQGAQKTGGIAITPTITTVQDGSTAVTGPANRFGLVAADGATPIASSQYYPPATDSEESYASVTDAKTITAQSGSVSVDAVGLDGEEKIERGSSVLVEDVTHLEENP